MAFPTKQAFVSVPRYDLPAPSETMDDFMAKLPKWTILNQMDLMSCKMHNKHVPCITFATGVVVTDADVEPILSRVTPKAAALIRQAVQHIDTINTKLAACDIMACVNCVQDCTRHAKNVDYTHRVFLFVCRIFMGIRHFVREHAISSPQLPIEQITRRLATSYASWLYHVSFYDHIFSAASLRKHMRVGYTWLTEAWQIMQDDMTDDVSSVSPAKTSSASTSNGTHIFDRPFAMQVILSALHTRLLELSETHSRVMEFVASRSKSGMESTFSLRADEMDVVKEYVAHLGHLYDTQQNHARLIESFMVHRDGVESVRETAPTCIDGWRRIIASQRNTAGVLFYAVVALYTESKQQNVALAAFARLEDLLQDYTLAHQHAMETTPVSRCITIVQPPDLNLNGFFSNVFVHTKAIAHVLSKQIIQLQLLNPDNMPSITNVQAHSTLRMTFDEWEAAQKAIDLRATFANPGVNRFGFALGTP